MERLTRPQLYMRQAELYAQRSTCLRAQVGAVIIKDKNPIAAGYNGAPPGLAHCTTVGCEAIVFPEMIAGFQMPHIEEKELLAAFGCQRCNHAEANAIAVAARRGDSVKGATMYCTYSPCKACAMLMGSAGIQALVFKNPYRATPWDLLDEMKILCESVLDK